MISGLLELFVFSLPSIAWSRRLRRSGRSRAEALDAVGLRWGRRSDYLVALLLVIPGTALGGVLLGLIPSHVLHGGSKNLVAAPHTAGDDFAIVALAAAEEMLFRGFLAGLLFRRFGFRVGNVWQALVFLAPHTLLLLVSHSLWPLLPLQLTAGWFLGWLRWRSGSVGPPTLAHALSNLIPALLFGV